MNKLEQIERLGKAIADSDYFGEDNDQFMLAQDILDAGYGNVKQYQNEIDRLHTELAHREEDLIHADEEVFYRETAVKLDEDKIKKQAVKEFAEKLKEQMELNGYRSLLHNRIIDNLITELYGADE